MYQARERWTKVSRWYAVYISWIEVQHSYSYQIDRWQTITMLAKSLEYGRQPVQSALPFLQCAGLLYTHTCTISQEVQNHAQKVLLSSVFDETWISPYLNISRSGLLRTFEGVCCQQACLQLKSVEGICTSGLVEVSPWKLFFNYLYSLVLQSQLLTLFHWICLLFGRGRRKLKLPCSWVLCIFVRIFQDLCQGIHSTSPGGSRCVHGHDRLE